MDSSEVKYADRVVTVLRGEVGSVSYISFFSTFNNGGARYSDEDPHVASFKREFTDLDESANRTIILIDGLPVKEIPWKDLWDVTTIVAIFNWEGI